MNEILGSSNHTLSQLYMLKFNVGLWPYISQCLVVIVVPKKNHCLLLCHMPSLQPNSLDISMCFHSHIILGASSTLADLCKVFILTHYVSNINNGGRRAFIYLPSWIILLVVYGMYLNDNFMCLSSKKSNYFFKCLNFSYFMWKN